MTEEQNKLAEEIERILAEYHRAVELDDASLLPKIMSQWCDLFFKPGASAILAGLREPATEAVLRELVIEAREEFRHHSPEMDSWLVRADAALKGKGASQGALHDKPLLRAHVGLAPEPSGDFVMVPREPTDAMQERCANIAKSLGYAITLLEVEHDWDKCLQYLIAVRDKNDAAASGPKEG